MTVVLYSTQYQTGKSEALLFQQKKDARTFLTCQFIVLVSGSVQVLYKHIGADVTLNS